MTEQELRDALDRVENEAGLVHIDRLRGGKVTHTVHVYRQPSREQRLVMIALIGKGATRGFEVLAAPQDITIDGTIDWLKSNA